MRGRYLFDLAFLCHMGAPEVDALRLIDFIAYVLNIDAYWLARKKANTPEGG